MRTWVWAISIIVLGSAGLLFLVFRPDAAERTTPFKFENPGGLMTQVFNLETAANEEERARGLMFRKTLSPDHGMIFIFPDDKERVFWMKNTFVSLDMLFVDSAMKVVGILSDVPVLNEERRTVGKPSRYVIELPAGTARKFGIVVGSTGMALGKLPPPS